MRWAEALSQAGRPREAADALEQALTSFRTNGDLDGQARALIQLAIVARTLGEGRLALATEAVKLLEPAEPGATLVAAHTQLANDQFLAGHYAEAIAAAEQAQSLAEELGLPPPARALGFHGLARAILGDPDGLAEMEQALALMIEQGAGRDAAALQNNLALARFSWRGRAARWPPSSRASPSASSAASPRRLPTWPATCPVCWSSSAAPRRRSNRPPSSQPPPTPAATRSRSSSCARSSSPASSTKATPKTPAAGPTGSSTPPANSPTPTSV